MNVFIRRIAVLSALWTVCELLLPEGAQQKIARLTVSVMVMAVLVSTLSSLVKGVDYMPDMPVLAEAEAVGGEAYRSIALQSVANQAKGYCERAARNAGYSAEASVALRSDGSAERVTLLLSPLSKNPLLAPDELEKLIAEQLQIERSRIAAEYVTDGAMR